MPNQVKSTSKAFETLRPVLQQLKVQEIKQYPLRVQISKHKDLKEFGLQRWVIIIRRFNLRDTTIGLVKTAWDKKRDLFLLLIDIDESLFANDENNDIPQQKMIAIHEFTHGAAYMFLFAYVGREKFIDLMNKKIIEQVKITTSDQYNEWLTAIKEFDGENEVSQDILTDTHYRLLNTDVKDGFLGNYAELFIELMLSYDLFKEAFLVVKSRHPKAVNISELLGPTATELINTKALNKNFVIARIRQFLPRFYSEFSGKS